jgi:hypothetical protein
MGIDIKVVAFGFGSLALAFGAILLGLAFNYTPQHTTDPNLVQQEMNAGWILVGIGVFAWVVGVVKSLV